MLDDQGAHLFLQIVGQSNGIECVAHQMWHDGSSHHQTWSGHGSDAIGRHALPFRLIRQAKDARLHIARGLEDEASPMIPTER